MRIIAKSFLTVVALMVVLVWSVTAAEDPNKGKQQAQSLYKKAGSPIFTLLNINNWTCWIRWDSWGNLAASTDNEGIYPRGTGNAIYADGIYWGGKAYTNAAKTIPAPRQLVRVGGKGYGFGMRPGRVIGSGATAVAQSPADAAVRIYRIRRDYASMSTDELKRDAAEINEIPIVEVSDAQIAAVVAQYEKDWKEWPIAYGAPYVDRNRNSRFDAPPPFSATFTVDSLIAQNRDEPGVAGGDPNSPADQVVWTVANDLDVSQTLQFQGAEPLGLEIQFTIWGYKRTDALGNLFFKRAKIINKGGVEIDAAKTKGSFYIDSVYVCNWSDIDLGDAFDDLAGCDSTLSLSFIYNVNAIDGTYRKYNLPPPASGYDFLAGPKVPSPGDSAVFDLKRIYGYKNLGMTSFAYFSAGSPYSDPCNRETAGYLCSTGQWWKMLRGFAPIGTLITADVPYERGPFPPSNFPLSGDPVTGKGFVDGLGTNYSFASGDRRILASTGPFTLAPGDTQEVVVGVVGGLGADRLSSVAVMKFNDRFVQNTYDALFQVPRPPKSPNVVVAELDGQVVLDWGSDLARVKDVEETVSQPGSYVFEGYNVYQLPSRSARLSESKRVVTFDLLTDPTVVLDEQFDQSTGQILRMPVQFGANSDIQRYFNFRKDWIRDIDKIYNGQEYYLAVTAYSVATVPGYLPAALESTPIVLTVRAKVPFGKVYQSHHGDTLIATHAGVSDGVIRPIVIDPTASTGNTYEVRFDTTGGEVTWRLLNKTKGTTLLSRQTNQSGDGNYKVVEGGIFLKVEGPPPGMKDYQIPPSGARRWTWGDADGNHFEGFNGAIGWDAPAYYFNSIPKAVKADQLKNTLVKLATASSGATGNPATGIKYGGWDRDATTDANMSYAYRYLRGATSAAAQPDFVPYIINKTSGYAYQDYKKSVPFSAWDVEATPPKRLAVGFLENNVTKGLVDGRHWPPPNGAGVTNTESTGPREWFFVFNTPYTGATPDAALQKDILNNPLPVMWWGTVNRRGGADYSQPPLASGDDQVLILANHVNTPNDVFTYVAPAAVTSPELEKQSAQTVGVFPNPYYAFNAAETNRFARFVTFNNLPRKATFRIFNLAGQLVRRMDKDDVTQFARWDLYSEAGFPVASGIYIVHIDMPDIGVVKVLKVAVIQEQEVLDSY